MLTQYKWKQKYKMAGENGANAISCFHVSTWVVRLLSW